MGVEVEVRTSEGEVRTSEGESLPIDKYYYSSRPRDSTCRHHIFQQCSSVVIHSNSSFAVCSCSLI